MLEVGWDIKLLPFAIYVWYQKWDGIKSYWQIYQFLLVLHVEWNSQLFTHTMCVWFQKWEGTVSCRRKGGDNISHYCQIVPIMGQNGCVS